MGKRSLAQDRLNTYCLALRRLSDLKFEITKVRMRLAELESNLEKAERHEADCFMRLTRGGAPTGPAKKKGHFGIGSGGGWGEDIAVEKGDDYDRLLDHLMNSLAEAERRRRQGEGLHRHIL